MRQPDKYFLEVNSLSSGFQKITKLTWVSLAFAWEFETLLSIEGKNQDCQKADKRMQLYLC